MLQPSYTLRLVESQISTCDPILHLIEVLLIIHFNVDFVNGEVCLQLFVSRGKYNLHTVPFKPFDCKFSYTC